MKKMILVVTLVMGSAAMSLWAEPKEAEIRLRDLDSTGLLIDRGQLMLTATFDVKGARIFDEVVFDFYLLLRPQAKEMKSPFLHCRTVHRYLDRRSGLKSGIILSAAAVEGINPRDEQYAVVVTYKGKEVGVENSEKTRWWENPALGDPVENVLVRIAEVPIVREWESTKKD